MPDDVLKLEPVNVPEWDAEDLLAADLGDEASIASVDEARAMFERITLTLPPTILHQELIGFAATRQTPLGEPIRVAGETFDFHLVELPLNILLPEDRRLVRLKLSIEAKHRTPTDSDAAESSSDPVVAYDLYPADAWDDKVHDLGEASLEVSAALRFVFPALPVDALGLKLALPIRWRTRYVAVRTSDRLSNPIEWYVRDSSITQGFTCYSIWRAPKNAALSIDAQLWGEVRSSGLFGRMKKAQFHAGKLSYAIDRPAR